jgi:predicted ester cyclase
MNKPETSSNEVMRKNKITATRFIEAFNTDDWDTVREVVASDYVFHHPLGGTIQAGPEGMVGAWSVFKGALPDSWHPIPIMIAEGDYLSVLLPTYGTFTKPHENIPPTGKWLEYGMVNMARFQDGKLAEMWFGMDSLAEQQQMGVAPPLPQRELREQEQENIELFLTNMNRTKEEFDNLTAFGDTVIAMGPPQYEVETNTRTVEIYQVENDSVKIVRSREFAINPPYSGDETYDKESSRKMLESWFEDVLVGHDLSILDSIVSPNVLIHRTAMPCEADFYGHEGIKQWMAEQWSSFPDLTITDYFTVAQGNIVAARWTARGTSEGNFLILPPSGEPVEYTGVSMFLIEDAKITEIWETRNTLGIMMQINPRMGEGQHTHQ